MEFELFLAHFIEYSFNRKIKGILKLIVAWAQYIVTRSFYSVNIDITCVIFITHLFSCKRRICICTCGTVYIRIMLAYGPTCFVVAVLNYSFTKEVYAVNQSSCLTVAIAVELSWLNRGGCLQIYTSYCYQKPLDRIFCE